MTIRSLFGVNGNGATGPSSASAFSGGYQAGVIFKVTSNGLWLDGYWWWCCNTGQQTSAVTFALWQPVSNGVEQLVPNSSVTSGTLTPGQWNYTALPAPIGLSATVPYTAVAGYTSTTGFPFTGGQFGAAETYAAGITNGPLFAYSDAGGSAPAPASQTQGLFGTGTASGANANANYPASGSSGSANFWIDVQIDDTAPANAAVQLWPSQPVPVNSVVDDTTALGGVVTVATEFKLSKKCTLNELLVYSPSGATSLPTKCAIYNVATQAQVAGTLLSSPSWKNSSGAAAAAGDGWISAAYSGVSLLAGDYKCAAAAPAGKWNATTGPDYWQNAGPGASGITDGALSAPNNATATSPGQSTYNGGGADIAYPLTIQAASAFTYWVDVLVTPVPPVTAGGLLTVAPAGGAVPRVSQSGSWWQLLSVREHAREEFNFYANRPPMACPRCGEPLINAPTADSGSGAQLFCRFDGWQYPRDWVRPMQF